MGSLDTRSRRAPDATPFAERKVVARAPGGCLAGAGAESVGAPGCAAPDAVSGVFAWVADGAAPRGDPERVRAAQEAAERLLARRDVDAFASGDARRALAVIRSLPPPLAGRLLETLSPGAFARLLEQLPPLSLLETEVLIPEVHDPVRKLLLWSRFHPVRAIADAAAERLRTADEGNGRSRSAAQAENARQNARRERIVETTAQEVEAETRFLLQRARNGAPLQEAEVDALIRRKALEHRTELAYNVDLTSDVERGAQTDPAHRPTDRVSWSEAELAELAACLARLPDAHVRSNPGLREIRRVRAAQTWDGVRKAWVDLSRGGYADPGAQAVYVTDLGAAGAPWRIHARSALAQSGAGVPSRLQEVLAHEIGHTVHGQSPGSFRAYERAAGWEGLSPQEMALRSGRSGGVQVDKTYRADPYGDGYLGVDRGAIPAGRDWDYARAHPYEHFAEHYAKAVHAPEALHADLVSGPREEAARARAALREVRAWPESDAFARAAQAVAHAESVRASRGEAWRIMREEVFHLRPSDVARQVRRLAARVPANRRGLVEEFRAEAAMCVTRGQLAALWAAYVGRVAR